MPKLIIKNYVAQEEIVAIIFDSSAIPRLGEHLLLAGAYYFVNDVCHDVNTNGAYTIIASVT